ncbi:thioredoxin-like domain-containing protein [Leptolyngbya ohadii]|uniref:thioredoxin-like domain-containing protein n=1 Tax=Leptolyngbya ohadii TaxID=1962290 RepID=UPI000B59B014|nr:thioredoxin-like domain-containing protein [Leptolyngbya ohadii]
MARIRAPELSPTFPWLNTPHPLLLKTLRGRIVLLDFWTYGCINCLHVIPDLHDLEQKYGKQLTIVGVHTAKFDREQEVESVRQAVLRYGITHPVIVDQDRALWNQYAVRAYPTFVLINTQGYIVGTWVGEGRRQILDDRIAELIEPLLEAYPDQSGQDELLQEDIATSQFLIESPLAFPGKVLAHEASDTLFIADTGHHRIVMTTLAGRLKGTIGTGMAGWQDGSWENAQFAAPQGMAIDPAGQMLYVADAGNHLIRQVDLHQQTVTTIAGTGGQSRFIFPHGGRAREVDLNSPWDLALLNDRIYIAMAGAHQIWVLDQRNGTIQTLIGTGAEFCVDGTPDVAAFAQPYGITTDGNQLFVADSETSAVRVVSQNSVSPNPIFPNPVSPHSIPIAKTLCGLGQLYGFGDVDGVGEAVQLQHCSGLTYAQGFLWLADTYNHKIKQIDPVTRNCLTVAGQTVPGLRDGMGEAVQFAEPSGLAAARDQLYIADTNNHAIRCLNLQTLTIKTLSLPDLCSPFVCLP